MRPRAGALMLMPRGPLILNAAGERERVKDTRGMCAHAAGSLSLHFLLLDAMGMKCGLEVVRAAAVASREL